MSSTSTIISNNNKKIEFDSYKKVDVAIRISIPLIDSNHLSQSKPILNNSKNSNHGCNDIFFDIKFPKEDSIFTCKREALNEINSTRDTSKNKDVRINSNINTSTAKINPITGQINSNINTSTLKINPITGQFNDDSNDILNKCNVQINKKCSSIGGSLSLPTTPVRIRQPPGGHSSGIF